MTPTPPHDPLRTPTPRTATAKKMFGSFNRGSFEYVPVHECEKIERDLTASLRALEEAETALNDLLMAAEWADETGYVTDAGFLDIEEIHEKARQALARIRAAKKGQSVSNEEILILKVSELMLNKGALERAVHGLLSTKRLIGKSGVQCSVLDYELTKLVEASEESRKIQWPELAEASVPRSQTSGGMEGGRKV